MSNSENIPRITLGTLNWGDLRHMEPVSERWGFDRGKPIDRYYIEAFLRKNEIHIQGNCIEVMNDNYIRMFGGEKVSAVEVLDIDPGNEKATITGDLTRAETLPLETFDCFILTQTLPVIYDIRAALINSYTALKPGGVLLITAPTLCRYSPHPEDLWRFTDVSIRKLIKETMECEDLNVSLYGNLVTSIGFLLGIASEELSKEELNHFDKRFPIIVAASLRKRR